jgi:hypothetical protein
MKNMEKSKYLEPKSSQSIAELIKFMQNYQETLISSPAENEKEHLSEQLPEIELKSVPADSVNEKKKSSHWVERNTGEGNSNKVVTEQEVQTMGTLNKISNDPKAIEERMEFKRTVYQPPNIRALNLNNPSRSNLSRDKS